MASIRKRTWRSGGEVKTAWVADYVDQSGKRHLKTFRTRKAADAFLIEARGEVTRGVHTADSGSATVAEAAGLWLRRGEGEELEYATMKAYRSRVRYHIVPLIGQERLSRLTKPRVEAFVDELLRTRSRAMAQKCLTNLKGIISEAQRRGLVAQNVARDVRVRIAKRHQEQVIIPSKAEVRTLIDATPARWRPLLVTAVFTGLRASELRGLRWSDVDLNGKVIRVRQRADEQGTIGSTKSAAGRRDVPMAPHLVTTLKEWKLACPRRDTGQKDADGKPIRELHLVFPNGKGKVENLANLHNRFLMPLQVQLGMVDNEGKPRYGLHSMRHFYASWLIDQGFQPKRVQVLMGHSTITLTLDRYAHLFPNDADDQARLAIGELALVS